MPKFVIGPQAHSVNVNQYVINCNSCILISVIPLLVAFGYWSDAPL